MTYPLMGRREILWTNSPTPKLPYISFANPPLQKNTLTRASLLIVFSLILLNDATGQNQSNLLFDQESSIEVNANYTQDPPTGGSQDQNPLEILNPTSWTEKITQAFPFLEFEGVSEFVASINQLVSNLGNSEESSVSDPNLISALPSSWEESWRAISGPTQTISPEEALARLQTLKNKIANAGGNWFEIESAVKEAASGIGPDYWAIAQSMATEFSPDNPAYSNPEDITRGIRSSWEILLNTSEEVRRAQPVSPSSS